MAPIVDFAPYVIFFQNRDEYEFAVAAVGGTPDTGGFFDGSPIHAAEYFGIPIPFPSGDMALIPKGIYFVDFNTGKELNNFAPPNVIMNYTTDEYLVPGYPGSYGIGVGEPRIIRWSGLVLYMQTGDPINPALPTTIPQRRFIGGLENGANLEGSNSAINTPASRQASRTLDGLGFPIRGNNGSTLWNRFVNQYTGVPVNKSRERLYFRLRAPGLVFVGFWRCHCSGAANAGAMLAITPAGELALYTVSAAGVATLRFTSPVLELLLWYKLDILLEYPSAAPSSGTIDIFLNGLLLFSFVDSSGDSMDVVGFHQNTDIGKGVGAAAFGSNDAAIELDLDDWINTAWPENLGVLSLDSPDWFMGSHVRRGFVSVGTVVNWLPAAIQIANQSQNPEQAMNSELASSTASALIEGTVDLPLLGEQDKMGEVALGAVAAVVGVNSTNAGADGSLGYSVAGGAAVMTVIPEAGIPLNATTLYNPSGLILPAEITPFKVRYTKGADASAATVRALQAAIEYIGIWGPEDAIDPDLFPLDLPRDNNLHNCLYYNTPYGFMGPTLDSNVFVKGGTYIGNSTTQDIALPDACHMLLIRPTINGTNGVKWFAAALGGHLGTTERVVPNMPVRVWYDAVAGTFKFTVTGSNVEVNQNALTYQYIAFCDPGMRFCCAGAYSTPSTITSRANLLQNPAFTPEFGFVQHDLLGSSSNTQGLWCKGPGNVGNTGNIFNSSATVIADFGSFSEGVFTSRANVHIATLHQQNYIMFRSTEPNCGYTMLQILSYIGDGTGTRVINLTPVSGRFPLFALVVPTSGAQRAVFRDPSHAGANSSLFNDLTGLGTGIIAGGIDTITVATGYNVLNVVYNVFVIPGSEISWANGTFFPPNCDSPEAFYNPIMEPPEVAVMGDGGILLGASTAITVLKDVSGLYTLVDGKITDTIYNRISGASTEVRAIPNPIAKTGFING